MEIECIQDIYIRQRNFFASHQTKDPSFRIQMLKRLQETIQSNESRITQALYKDLHKPAFEAYTSEIGIVYEEISHALRNVKKWMKPRKVSTPIVHFPSVSKVYFDPLGLTLIIGPWNYPFQLLLSPLVGAIAGGNCAILKPSNQAAYTAAIIEEIISAAFPRDYIAVVQGSGADVIPEMVEKFRFDHIFFTGSVPVGKKIMQAAARHLTPVTLELGGKSPCIIDADVNMDVAAKRLAWAKFWNAGQTCVAPDYLLVHESIKETFLERLKQSITAFFGTDASSSEDYGHIVNSRRLHTLQEYLGRGKVIFGGKSDESILYMEPTLVEGIEPEDPIMQEEIFGPILPVMVYNTREEAAAIIERNPYPLALYLFTTNQETEEYFVRNVRFGGGCINNALVHLSNPHLPFGGVGYSGMGQYHGKYSFDTFTHMKGILKTSMLYDNGLKYAPFGSKLNVVKKFMR